MFVLAWLSRKDPLDAIVPPKLCDTTPRPSPHRVPPTNVQKGSGTIWTLVTQQQLEL